MADEMRFREIVLPDGRMGWELIPTIRMIKASRIRQRYGVHEAFRYIDAGWTKRITQVSTRKYKARKGR